MQLENDISRIHKLLVNAVWLYREEIVTLDSYVTQLESGRTLSPQQWARVGDIGERWPWRKRQNTRGE